MEGSKNFEINKLSDEDLIASAKSGDEQTTEEIFLRYRAGITEIARSYYLLGGEIEDLVQEGMLGLFKAVKTYRPQSGVPFENYAKRCIKNGIISAVRAASGNKHKALNNVSSEVTDFDEEFGDESMDPENKLINKERETDIDKKFKEILSVKEYEVYKLYLKGFSFKDIGKELKIEEKSVDNAVQRIKKKAKEVKWDI